ncbi:universal stress protein [Marinomonas transparens]|uniref:Universal stress protein n=1 Tax=Marinomonas transparens TaxID=2795388 RepID=A0A934N0G7_9GAMM|nr:universal stress protein [Marinomonas transparens]MBJ7536692.1 universal stress protein [Marinomonas transparens]
MSATIIVGVDGSEAGDRAVAYAKRLANLIGSECKLELVCVVEWSPYTFQTPEENSLRKKQKEVETQSAQERVIEPALKALKEAGIDASGYVKFGKASTILNNIAVEGNAEQIVVARSTEQGLSARVFGSVTANLVMSSNVPVTVVS